MVTATCTYVSGAGSKEGLEHHHLGKELSPSKCPNSSFDAFIDYYWARGKFEKVM